MSIASTSRRTARSSGASRRFIVDPPSRKRPIEILKGLRDRYEDHHRVQITDDALAAAVELSGRYITGRVQPDKAIDVIDEAGARVRLKSMTKPPDLADIEKKIETLSISKDEAVKKRKTTSGRQLRDTGREAAQAKRKHSTSSGGRSA